MTFEVRREADRFVTTRPGSITRYSFSFGHHYDAHNVSFGPVVAVNDERLAPGAGFESHPHAGLVIVTYVVCGSLSHHGLSDATVTAGQVAVLRTGDGVLHAETNHGISELRFVQTWLTTGSEDISYDVTTEPVAVDDAVVTAGRLMAQSFTGHLFVATGTVDVDGTELGAGDSVRASSPVVMLPATGAELVLVSWPGAALG